MADRRDRLIKAREAAGYGSARSAALAMGWPESTYRSHENGTRGIPKDESDKYADGFRVSREWLFYGRGPMLTAVAATAPPPSLDAPAAATFPPPIPASAINLYSRRMIPLFKGTGGEKEGIVDFVVVEHVPCPSELENVPDAYAVYVIGVSMEPRYHEGERIYIHPHKPPKPGDYVLIRAYNGDGSTQGHIKVLVSIDKRSVVAFQLNPRKEVTFPAETVVSVHRIVMAASD